MSDSTLRQVAQLSRLSFPELQERWRSLFGGEFGCARYAPGAEQWLRDQLDLYESYGWSWAYWAFREWDVVDIEKMPDAADKQRYPETPLLQLFSGYFARDTDFPAPE
jgi:hypothetical protein